MASETMHISDWLWELSMAITNIIIYMRVFRKGGGGGEASQG